MFKRIVTDRSVLHELSREIDMSKQSDINLAETTLMNLKDTLDQTRGVGIAAPQIGEHLRVFIFRQGTNFLPVINPSFEPKNKKVTLSNEGCLSCPGQVIPKIVRHKCIYAKWVDLLGNEVSMTLTGMSAIIFQHEYDHLNGKLITDKEL